MRYDYNDKKSATATVRLPATAPWATRVTSLSGTATDPNKDITGIKARVLPRQSLGAAVDAAAGATVNQVRTAPVLVPEVLPQPYFPEQWRPLSIIPTGMNGIADLLQPKYLALGAALAIGYLYLKRK